MFNKQSDDDVRQSKSKIHFNPLEYPIGVPIGVPKKSYFREELEVEIRCDIKLVQNA